MQALKIVSVGLAIGAVGLGLEAFAFLDSHRGPRVESIDFGKVITPTLPVYRADLRPASRASVKEFRIPITDDTVQIADGVKYVAWTFGGTVPGPTLRVREGDSVRITIVNNASIAHSIDLHAARIPVNVAFRSINPGEELSFAFVARDPGAYMVHCGTPPVLMHLMQGMYMTIIVDPKDGWGTKADREFVLVQSEWYSKAGEAGAPMMMDWNAGEQKNASYVVFNGRAGQYKEHPLQVNVGDRVRFFVVNAGPSLQSDFHIVGAVFDRVYPDGNPAHALEHVQTYEVPAGGGAVFEAVFDKDGSGEGVYPFVTHAFADASKGAVGMIQVGQPKLLAAMSH
jgi:nitrite reductase (NO-forming)